MPADDEVNGRITCKFRAIKKQPPLNGVAVYQFFCAFVDDVFGLSNGEVKFFCQRLETDTVNQPSAKNCAIALGVSSVDVLFDSVGDFRVCHFLVLTRPVP